MSAKKPWRAKSRKAGRSAASLWEGEVFKLTSLSQLRGKSVDLIQNDVWKGTVADPCTGKHRIISRRRAGGAA